MRYTTDDMRNWANDEPDLGVGGSKTAMREAADEIDVLRAALERLVIATNPLKVTPDDFNQIRNAASKLLGRE